MFSEAIEDTALYHDAVILALATRHGWPPHEVAAMPIEWVFKALQFDSAKDSVKAARNSK